MLKYLLFKALFINRNASNQKATGQILGIARSTF